MSKVGDVFVTTIEGKKRAYFQFVAIDATQLNSDVICVYDITLVNEEPLSIKHFERAKVKFYCHVVVDWGKKMKLWKKVKNMNISSNVPPLKFRQSDDYGDPEIRQSDRWWVWTVGEEMQYIGSLRNREERNYEIGVIMAPPNVIDRIYTGKYSYFYPDI